MREMYKILCFVCMTCFALPGWGFTTDTTQTAKPTKVPPEKTRLVQATETLNQASGNEQGFANQMLGGATTAATGLGMMTAASAYSEQRADADAERDMTAYLATMKCEYGHGQSVRAGGAEVTLPGGNELLAYYSEYKALADNVKHTKKALGLRSGIESEVLYDRAESGLYQYASTGKTDGAYTSLSRALTDTDSKDAADWATQKEESATKLKTGLIATGAGVAAGVVGNYLINGNRPKTELQQKIETEIQEITEELPEFVFQPQNPTINTYAPEKPELNTTNLRTPIMPTPTTLATREKPIHLELKDDTTFESGKSVIKDKTALENLTTRLKNILVDLHDDQKICIDIIGHTDRTKFKKGSKMTNEKLSENRATAVYNELKTALSEYENKVQFSTPVGKGPAECTSEKYENDNDAQCRKVELFIQDCTPTTTE